MIDHEVLDQLAALAPTLMANYADLVLARARRTRLWRRIAWSTGFGTATVGILAAALLLPPGNRQVIPVLPSPSVTVSASSVPRSAEASVYATSIARLAEAIREDGPPVRNLYILDHTCDNIIRTPSGDNDTCHPQPLSASLRSELTTALAGYARVGFVSSVFEVRQPGTLTIVNDGIFVRLGPAQISYDRALVPLDAARNGFQYAALTYDLRRRDGVWVIVGTVGSSATG